MVVAWGPETVNWHIALWYGDSCFYIDLFSVSLKIDYCSISKETTVERAEKWGSMRLYKQIKKRSKSLSSKYCFFSFTTRVTMQGGGRQNCSDMFAFHASSWSEQGCKAAGRVHCVLLRDAKQSSGAEDCEMIKILMFWLICFLSVSLFEIHDCTSPKAVSWLNPLHWFSLLHQTGGDKKAWKDSWLEDIAGRGMRWQLKSQTLGWCKQTQN